MDVALPWWFTLIDHHFNAETSGLILKLPHQLLLLSSGPWNTKVWRVLWFVSLIPQNHFNSLTCVSLFSQGENPIYKSAVTTVVNPKYEGKWWSFAVAVSTLYGEETWVRVKGGGGFITLSLFVCFVCLYVVVTKMIAMHSATISVCFTNLVYFLCIVWNVYSLCKCGVLYLMLCLCRTREEKVLWTDLLLCLGTGEVTKCPTVPFYRTVKPPVFCWVPNWTLMMGNKWSVPSQIVMNAFRVFGDQSSRGFIVSLNISTK